MQYCISHGAIFAEKASVRELVKTNRSLAEKIRDFLVDFVEKIRSIAERYADRAKRSEIYAMLENEEGLAEIARTFDLALRSADEKQGRAEVETTGAEEVKFSMGQNEMW